MKDKFQREIGKILENSKNLSEEELDAKIQELVDTFNEDKIEYTPLDEAYEFLEEAQNANSLKKAKEYAKKAYEKSNDCLDALVFLSTLEEDTEVALDIINEGIEREKSRLEKEEYFTKEYIGIFYGVMETRQYIRALFAKADHYIHLGRMTLAKETFKEILRLNNNDNTGARYRLMAIYAYEENEKELLKLRNKYKENNFETLFPMFALYYKLGDKEKAKEYFKKMCDINKNFIKLMKGKLKPNERIPEGCYSIGDSSEILMYFNNNKFLLFSIPELQIYSLRTYKELYSKSKK